VSLGLALEPPPQEVRDDEAQNPIAEEFETFIAAVSGFSTAAAATLPGRERTRMRQGFFEEFGPSEEIPDLLPEIGGQSMPVNRCPSIDARQSMPWTPWNSRPYRIANGHLQISQSRADPLVEKKMNCAFPIRFSAGT
jgi:hypothetical protein